MKRKKLGLSDVAGDLLEGYEKKYQEILSNYKMEKKKCSIYREDIKPKKIAEIQNKYLSQAKNLKNKLSTELTEILESKKIEFSQIQEAKNKPLDLDGIFTNTQNFMTTQEQYNKQMIALKHVYSAIEHNSKLQMANSLLKTGDIKAIGYFLENNIDNKDLVNIVEANLKSSKKTEYNDLLNDIKDSRTTEVDDLTSIINDVKYQSMYPDKLNTLPTINGTHDLNADFDRDGIFPEGTDITTQFFK